MKKLIPLFCILSLLTFVSCGQKEIGTNDRKGPQARVSTWIVWDSWMPSEGSWERQ